MTGEDPSRQLIERLAADLQPVRPIAPLHRSFAAVLVGALALAGVTLAVAGPQPDVWTRLAEHASWGAVLVGLAAAVAGAGLAALASVVPGREAVVRAGAGLAALGLALGAAAAASAVWGGGDGSLAPAELWCIARGAVFAAPPAALVLYAASRGWAGRPGRTVALGLVAAGAVGAAVVHLSCPAVAPLHLLCTHAGTPLLLAAVGTALVLPAMRARAR